MVLLDSPPFNPDPFADGPAAPALISGAPMSYPTPKEIEKKIRARREHSGFNSLLKRMEDDWSIIRLNPYQAGEGYQSYTSNRPRNMFDKVVSWLSEARMVVRTSRSADEQMSEAGGRQEKFFRGCVRENDERLQNMLAPTLQDYTAFTIAARGWYIGRAMFNNKALPGGQMSGCPEIEPWDPLHMAYDADARGVAWLGRVHRRSLTGIESTFGVRMENIDRSAFEEASGLETFEYMDRDIRAVVAHDQFLVSPERHFCTDGYGQPLVPGYIGFQGVVPFLQPILSEDIVWADVGESVLVAIRNLVDVQNKSMSDWMTLVRRAVKHPLILRSKDGKFRLLNDPYREGSNIPLKEGETIELAPEMKLLADAAAFMGIVGGEWQQGTLPDIVFGDLRLQISGNAANILRSGAQHQVTHRLKGMGAAFRQAGNVLRFQYMSGGYGSNRFSGYSGAASRRFYDEEITPESLEGAGYFDVVFRNQLGFEDPQRFTTAATLKEAGLAPDDWIYNEVLEVEDVDEWKSMLAADKARQVDPKAAMVNLWEGLQDTGKPIEAMFMEEQIKRIAKQEMRDDFVKTATFQLQMRQMLAALASADPAAAAQIMQEMSAKGMGGGGGAPQLGGGAPQESGGGVLDMNNAVMSNQDRGLDPGFRVESGQSDNARMPGEVRPGAGNTPLDQRGQEEARARAAGIVIARR